jgi:glycosyltransferase involved in cell wall biosynthesis
MCNNHFTESLPILKAMRCRTIWVSCMTCLLTEERPVYSQHGTPEFLVFQSEYQRSVLEPQFCRFGHNPERSHLIRGPFFADEFPYSPRPHVPGEELIIGRLSRPWADKWNSSTLRVCRDVNHPGRKALFMGVNEVTLAKLGPAPEWATYLAPGEITSQEFLSRCHALLCYNGGAAENWPRVGLEAMAAGVPLVAEKRWGWLEKLDHGESGYLATFPREMTDFLDHLASHETERLEMTAAARQRMTELTDQNTITAAWEWLLKQAGADQ